MYTPLFNYLLLSIDAMYNLSALLVYFPYRHWWSHYVLCISALTACIIMVHCLLFSFYTLDLASYLVLGQGITVTISLYHIHCMKFVSLFQYANRTSLCITAGRESDIPCEMSRDFWHQNLQVQSRDWYEVLCYHGSWGPFSCEDSQLCAAGNINHTSGEIVSLHWCKYIVQLE